MTSQKVSKSKESTVIWRNVDTSSPVLEELCQYTIQRRPTRLFLLTFLKLFRTAVVKHWSPDLETFSLLQNIDFKGMSRNPWAILDVNRFIFSLPNVVLLITDRKRCCRPLTTPQFKGREVTLEYNSWFQLETRAWIANASQQPQKWQSHCAMSSMSIERAMQSKMLSAYEEVISSKTLSAGEGLFAKQKDNYRQ